MATAAATKEDPLTRAIDNADEHTLRNVLKSMCQDSEACRKEAMERMLVSRKHELIELSDSSDDDGQRQDKKRKKVEVEVAQISRYEKCTTCKETYDVTLNNDEACRTHEGWPFDTASACTDTLTLLLLHIQVGLRSIQMSSPMTTMLHTISTVSTSTPIGGVRSGQKDLYGNVVASPATGNLAWSRGTNESQPGMCRCTTHSINHETGLAHSLARSAPSSTVLDGDWHGMKGVPSF
jgi:hypothetical protein